MFNKTLAHFIEILTNFGGIPLVLYEILYDFIGMPLHTHEIATTSHEILSDFIANAIDS